MIVARWSIDAKFGYKQTVIELMQRWLRRLRRKLGSVLTKRDCLPARSARWRHHSVGTCCQGPQRA